MKILIICILLFDLFVKKAYQDPEDERLLEEDLSTPADAKRSLAHQLMLKGLFSLIL